MGAEPLAWQRGIISNYHITGWGWGYFQQSKIKERIGLFSYPFRRCDCDFIRKLDEGDGMSIIFVTTC